MFNPTFIESEIEKNQQAIIALSKEAPNILLEPITIGGGNIEHYYHFIFDLMLPLSLLIKATNPNVVFHLHQFGLFTNYAVEIFKNRIHIIQTNTNLLEGKKMNLLGMNPNNINILKFPYQILKQTIFSALKIKSSNKPNKILLIERLPPDPYFLNDAKIKGSGTSRRSIQNHHELKELLKLKIKPSYVFENIQLEKMSFKEQIQAFESSVIVIGQHGAGLANILWMQEKSTVVEFGFENKTHFERLSVVKNHDYFGINHIESHITIDCSEFFNLFSNDFIITKYFLND
ncbi:glycosyltransferase family 61 protein [Pedobacter sp. SD-b]|uniref:Glycosyltransferase family 61 protein n=1 Tax=Pedobacter segetis TaxID=2793069 RepID=A0ABS1BI40_9SPHI|nr:glycosyltransferase family 61 protein [Pedobacter segetis]MBK0382515.1 glycosyltransferase family 61 protein [Pedobacter segetis]